MKCQADEGKMVILAPNLGTKVKRGACVSDRTTVCSPLSVCVCLRVIEYLAEPFGVAVFPCLCLWV